MKLTPREKQTLKGIAEGETRKALAADLDLSIKTVDWHMRHVYSKIGLNSVALLTQWAIKHGIAQWRVSLFLLASVALAAAFQAKDLRFEWDYPDASPDAFCLYSSTNLALPLTNWAKVTTAPGDSRTLTLPAVEAGAHFYFLTASNMWGESDPSNVAATPGTPAAGTLRVKPAN